MYAIISYSKCNEKNQEIKDAKNLFTIKVKKNQYKIILILKRRVCVWNNQNYLFNPTYISISFQVNEKLIRIRIQALLSATNKRNLKVHCVSQKKRISG